MDHHRRRSCQPLLKLGAALAPQAREHLGDPGQVGVFVGTVVRVLAMAVALVAGLAAARQRYRHRTRTGNQVAGGHWTRSPHRRPLDRRSTSCPR